MKVLETIKKIFITIIGIIYFTFALAMTILLLNFNDYGVTQFGDTSFIILKEKVSSEEFKKGDLVIVETIDIEDIQKKDTIFTYRVDGKGGAHIELGKVGEIYPDDNAVSFENGDTYSMEFVAGEATKVYSGWGTFLSIVESQWGFLFIVLVPCFLLFIYQVYALIVEIKYGAEEN